MLQEVDSAVKGVLLLGLLIAFNEFGTDALMFTRSVRKKWIEAGDHQTRKARYKSKLNRAVKKHRAKAKQKSQK